jgi:hypothetical protein
MPTPAHFPPLCDYIVVNDSSPASQVWSTTAGAFVAYSNAGYLSWLSGLFAGDPSTFASSYQILGATSASGGAATSLQVTDTGLFTNGQVFKVQGRGLYDGNQTLTVLDATHFTIPVAFTGNATGYLAGPSFIATMALLLAQIDAYNETLSPPPFLSITSGVNYSLANTPPLVFQFTPTTNNLTLTLPQVNLPGGLAKGRPLLLINGSPTIGFSVNAFGGAGLGLTMPGNAVGELVLTDDLTQAGTFTVVRLWTTSVASHGDAGASLIFGGALITTHRTSANLTAPRTWTLPSIFSWIAGAYLLIIDANGGVSATNTLSIARAGTDTINNGTAPVVLNRAHDWVLLQSDGVSNWNIVGGNGSLASTDLIDVTAGASWIPTDQSGAGLTFISVSAEYDQIGDRVFVSAEFTYPVQADPSINKVGGLPVAVRNKGYADFSITACGISGYGLPSTTLLNKGASTFQLQINNAGSFATNAQLSGSTVRVNFNYPAT